MQGGAPAYEYGWQPFTVDGVPYLELYVNQAQNPAYPVFTMPIDVVTTESGAPRTHKVWNDARVEHLLFRLADSNVTAVALDPMPWILKTGAAPVAFVEGPPKIITMNPVPNAVVPQPGPNTLEVVFHKDVTASAADFTLVGQRTGAVPFSFSYDGQRHAAHLTPNGGFATDTYTLTVHDSIRDTAANLALDGELVKPDSPDPLPSGDGEPGGNALSTFFVTSPGDLNCDGRVNFDDINPFVLALSDPAGYLLQYPGCPLLNADTNGNGQVEFSDINPFVALLMH
jgi:hypothetical protein